MISEGASAGMELEEIPLLMLGFTFSEDAFPVRLAGGKQVIKDTSQLMCGGGDGFWGAEFGAHTAVEVAKGRLVVVQGVSRNT